MEKTDIIEILEDWNFWTKDHDTGITRQKYLKKISKFASTEQIITINGVRRSGKSTIMLQYIKELIKKTDPKNILYVNFEDVRFKELNLELLNKIYETYLEYITPTVRPFIFLDEIQRIKGWEKFARTLHELKKAQIFVSGSTSKLMANQLAIVLTGRHLDINVFPLTFEEFLSFNEIEIKSKLELITKRHKIKSLLNKYLEYGGFPLVCLKKEKKEILQNYFEDIINKDILENHTITRIAKLKSLAKIYFSNAGKKISFNKISRSLNLSLDTVERYSYYLEEAFLIHFIKKFSYSVKEQEKTMAMVYIIDNGIKNLLCFRFSQDIGWLYQNTVGNHLIKKYGKENIFYWAHKNEEVDFIVKQGLKVQQLIQVCHSINNEGIKKREVNSLLKASRELRCKNLFIITEDYEAEEKIKNKKIKFMPLWKWLLG